MDGNDLTVSVDGDDTVRNQAPKEEQEEKFVHQCSEDLGNLRVYYYDEQTGWIVDNEFLDTCVLFHVLYCPYCGKKLEEPK